MLLTSHPDIALTVFCQCPYLYTLQVESHHPDWMTYQLVGASRNPEEATSQCAHIDIALLVYQSRTEARIATQDTDVEGVDRRLMLIGCGRSEHLEIVTTQRHDVSLIAENRRGNTF